MWCDQRVPGALRKGKQPLVGSEWGLGAWGPCLFLSMWTAWEITLGQLLTPLRAVLKGKILCFCRQWWLGNPLMIWILQMQSWVKEKRPWSELLCPAVYNVRVLNQSRESCSKSTCIEGWDGRGGAGGSRWICKSQLAFTGLFIFPLCHVSSCFPVLPVPQASPSSFWREVSKILTL